MRKYNDGYALPFVLIVMVIICLVGISIMSASLNNLQNQKASIERMQAQYEAEGKIERLTAKINSIFESDTLTGITKEMLIPVMQEGEKKVIECEFSHVLLDDSENGVKEIEISFFTIPQEGEKVCIQGELVIKPDPDNGKITVNEASTDSYTFTKKPVVSYSSYEIVDIQEGGN